MDGRDQGDKEVRAQGKNEERYRIEEWKENDFSTGG